MAFERNGGGPARKKIPAPARNTFLPGNPTAGEFGRRVIKQKERETTQQTQPQSNPKSEQPEKKSYTGTNPYYPKKKTTNFSGSSSTKKKIAGAFNGQSKTVKKSSGSNLNGSAGISGKSKKKSGEPISHGKSGKYSGGSLSAPKASKSKKSKKKR